MYKDVNLKEYLKNNAWTIDANLIRTNHKKYIKKKDTCIGIFEQDMNESPRNLQLFD